MPSVFLCLFLFSMIPSSLITLPLHELFPPTRLGRGLSHQHSAVIRADCLPAPDPNPVRILKSYCHHMEMEQYPNKDCPGRIFPSPNSSTWPSPSSSLLTLTDAFLSGHPAQSTVATLLFTSKFSLNPVFPLYILP